MSWMLSRKMFFLALMISCVSLQSWGYKDYFFSAKEGTQNSGKRPLVLWLHGCTQGSREFLELTDVLKVTAGANPIVYAPEQQLYENPLKCWNWFLPHTQKRAHYLESIVEKIKGLVKQGVVDENRVYVGGFSAGGVLAGHLAYCYPEMFSGALIHSGAPFELLKSYARGSENLGQWAYECGRPQALKSKLKTVMIFHGQKDRIAPFSQSSNTLKQSFDYFDLMDDGKTNKSVVDSGTTSEQGTHIYLKTGQQIHYFVIPGMGHAWSGSKEGMRFSSPKTLSATEAFYKLTDGFSGH